MGLTADYSYMEQNLAEVRAQIAAAKAAPHAARSVKLLAVSKHNPAEAAVACWGYGVDALAENRVQEMLEKQDAMPESIRDEVKWHLIGHLQTNKVRQIIGRVQMIHSLESERLAAEIEKRAAAAGVIMPCLIEVNMGGEESKFGLAPDEVADFVDYLAGLQHIAVRGLMTVAPDAPEAVVRPVFADMRRLRDDLRRKYEKFADERLDLQELSMGMSNDYRIAVEEGATMVRVGTRIFGARIYR